MSNTNLTDPDGMRLLPRWSAEVGDLDELVLIVWGVSSRYVKLVVRPTGRVFSIDKI